MSFNFPYPGPVPPYTNVPIQPENYEPRRFVISDISYGQTTIVTTEEDHDYVIGQEVRLMIPLAYGSFELNNVQGIVISIPDTDQVEIQVVSQGDSPFLTEPFILTITGASQTDPIVITVSSNNFNFTPGKYVLIESVGGMVELNGNTYRILESNATSLKLNVDAGVFTAYTSGGTATIRNFNTTLPQIIAIGDSNSGAINSNGRTNLGTYIPGSFINISPA